MTNERSASDLTDFEVSTNDRATLEAAGFVFSGASWGAYVFRNESIGESVRVGHPSSRRPFTRNSHFARARNFKTAAAAVK